MTQYFTMHSENPQPRLITQAVEVLKAGKLIIYPTDSTYAFGCALSSKSALEQIRKLRGISEKHPLTLVCHTISQAAEYSVIHNEAFSFIKRCTPGPFTIILVATKMVPKLAQGIKRKVVGIRIPENQIALQLVKALGEPILSATLWLAGDEAPMCNPYDAIKGCYGKIDLILDAGIGDEIPTTVVDYTESEPIIIRQGKGEF